MAEKKEFTPPVYAFQAEVEAYLKETGWETKYRVETRGRDNDHFVLHAGPVPSEVLAHIRNIIAEKHGYQLMAALDAHSYEYEPKPKPKKG